jgi:hypothetical protein
VNIQPAQERAHTRQQVKGGRWQIIEHAVRAGAGHHTARHGPGHNQAGRERRQAADPAAQSVPASRRRPGCDQRVKADRGQKHGEQDLPRQAEPQPAERQQPHRDHKHRPRFPVHARALARGKGGKARNDRAAPDPEVKIAEEFRFRHVSSVAKAG